MPASHLDLVRLMFEYDAEDRVDEMVGLLHEKVELCGAVGGLEEGEAVRGRQAVAEQLLPDTSVWSSRSYDVQKIQEIGDQVIVLAREVRRGRGSGVEVEADMAFIYSFNDDRISRIEPYMSQAEGLAAVEARKAPG